MENAINLAIKGGWKDDDVAYGMKEGETPSNGDPKIDGWFYSKETFIDPLFWQALGKSLGWKGNRLGRTASESKAVWVFEGLGAEYHWHCFIRHLAEGKDAESFFTNLLASKE